MRGCTADVIGLDWAVDIADARAALGQQRTIQVKSKRFVCMTLTDWQQEHCCNS